MNIRLNAHIGGKWFTYGFSNVEDITDVARLVEVNVPNFEKMDDYDVQVQASEYAEFNREDVRREIQRVIERGPSLKVSDEQDMMARWAASLKR